MPVGGAWAAFRNGARFLDSVDRLLLNYVSNEAGTIVLHCKNYFSFNQS